MSSLEELTSRFSTIKIILSNPQGQIIKEPRQHDYSSPDYGGMKPQGRAQSLPDIFQGSSPKIEDYFNKWRRQVEKRRGRVCTGEWAEKPTTTVSLDKMAEAFQKKNSVLEDSFMMEYNWSSRNKSTSY